jgi:hypothetical protein
MPYADEQNDLPEASFKALLTASKLNWRADAGVRLIVHIADHGNRDYGMTSGKSSLKETVRIEDVIAALKDAHIGYIPIAVLGATGGSDSDKIRERKTYRGKFREQARTISKAVGPDLKLAITYNDDRDLEGSDAPMPDIYTAVERSIEISTSGLKESDRERICGQDANSSACAKATVDASRGESPIIQFARDLKGIFNEEEERNIYSGLRQTVVQGYVQPFDRPSDPRSRSALSYWVVMDDQNIDDFAKAASTLCNAFRQGKNNVRSLQEELYLTLSVTGGGHASPGALLAERGFIPNFHLSPILSRPWREIENILRSEAPEDQENVRKWSERFCERSYLLELVKTDRRAFTKPKVQKGGLFKSDNERPFSWVYKGDQGLELYYVPVEFLP